MDRQLTVSRAKSRANASHWHAGWNMPGFLPEADPGTYASFREARDALAEELAAHANAEQTWNDAHDCDHVPCPTYGDRCHWQRAGTLRAIRDEVLGVDAENWSARSTGLAYWIEACTADSCRAVVEAGPA
jgi:hypothetical protein